LVEYHSAREGLAPLMEGMLIGITKMFGKDDKKILKEYSKTPNGPDHDLFRII